MNKFTLGIFCVQQRDVMYGGGGGVRRGRVRKLFFPSRSFLLFLVVGAVGRWVNIVKLLTFALFGMMCIRSVWCHAKNTGDDEACHGINALHNGFKAFLKLKPNNNDWD